MRSMYILENLLLPPALCMLLLLAGLALYRCGLKRLAVGNILGALLLLYVSSIPATARFIADRLEYYPPLGSGNCSMLPAEAAAIVVLGFRRDEEGREFGGTVVSGDHLERLRYAAHLHDCLALPVYVIGGDAFGTGVTNATVMARSLREDFHVPVSNGDGNSLHTRDNARFARELLARDGINHILLVSHAWHLPRATRLFRAEGFDVTPAPTAYTNFNRAGQGIGAWVPSARAMLVIRYQYHELLGLLLLALA